MSAAAVARFVASVSVDRACACGATFTVRRGEARVLCASCLHDAVERSAAGRECATAGCSGRFVCPSGSQRVRCDACRDEASAYAEARRREMRCDDCGTRLREPADLCGLCDPDFDVGAALAALDAVTNERPVAAGRSANPPGGNPE